MIRTSIIVCTLGFCLLEAMSAAQTTEKTGDSPEAVVTIAVNHARKMNWDAYMKLFHPEAVQDFHEMMMPIASGMQQLLPDPALADSIPPDERPPEEIVEFLNHMDEMPSQEFAGGFWNVLATMIPELGQAMSSLESEIIGGVPEGDTLVHVVTRNKTGGMGMEIVQMEVITVKKSPDGWRLMLSGRIKGLAQQLQRSFGR